MTKRRLLIVACISVAAMIVVLAPKTMIRIHNASQYDYQDLQVGDQRYGNLPAGGATEYRYFGIAYHYNYVRLLIDGHEFIIQPVDYVGEQPLGSGYFTYDIDVTGNGTRSLTITARTDWRLPG